MIHDVWFAVYHWCWNNGVQGNVAASALLGLPTAFTLYHKVWKKHFLPHFERSKEMHALTREIHTKVHQLARKPRA